MTTKVYLSNLIDWTTPTNSLLVSDIKNYFQNNVLPNSIGRDAPLTRPSDAMYAGLMHIHIGQFNAANTQYYRKSDDWLIYAKGLFSDTILLIDILSPDAHAKARELEPMGHYMRLGNEFRNQF